MNRLLSCVFAVFSFVTVYGLYEDQVGKFDWQQRYVGQPKFVLLDQHSGQKNLLVGTRQNVLASLSARDGEIAWRQILEQGEKGRLDGLHQSGTMCLSVTGGNTVRAWTASSGHLVWEVLLQPNSTKSGHSFLAVKDSGNDYLLVLHDNKLSGIEVVTGTVAWTVNLPYGSSHQYEYMISTSVGGVSVAGKSASTVVLTSVDYSGTITGKVLVAGLAGQDDVCEFMGVNYLVCGTTNGLIRYVKLGSDKVHTLTLGAPGRVKSIQTSVSQESAILLDVAMDTCHVIAEMRPEGLRVVKVLDKVTAVEFTHGEHGDHVIALSRRSTEDVLLEKYRFDGSRMTAEAEQVLHIPEHHGQPNQIHGLAYKKRDGTTGYRYLVLCDDHSILMLTQNGKVAWLREEALASILTVEMVDLPISENEQKIEDEFGSPDDDIFSMFQKRFMTQMSQLQLLFDHVKAHLKGASPQDQVEHDAEDEVDDSVELTRDRFNLHKMAVIATEAGKVYGIYSLTGSLVWRKYYPNLRPFSKHGLQLPLLVQRSTVHYPHPAQCLLLGKHKFSGNSLLVAFDPISGDSVEQKDLGYTVKQLMLMSHADEHSLKGVILLDSRNKVHVYPPSVEPLVRRHAREYFLFTADPTEGALNGFALQTKEESIVATSLWNVNLMPGIQTITNVVSKRTNEHVHSQGRVLSDRNVLYKYLNPNLVAITAQGCDQQQKSHDFLNVYLVDAVSGSIIFHANHKRVSGQVHVVHSENWLVYSYWSQKARRYEITVLELYEGQRQSNATVFSSLEAPPLPLVMRQAYIFPTQPSTMAVTLTEKGVTNKHLLVGLQLGGVLQLPMAFLDPRRPVEPTAEHREEGILPYMPELAVQTDNIINYNQSLMNIRGIYTSPAGLESTSLVFVYGLDIFSTRVFPSKMFDVLKEDFDYLFISAVVIGMILISLVSQKIASRKALHRNWK